ncbi:type II secretion system F family protein [Demequina sp. TTPB684]|uniref:type II secretion system F family protein n=1 Tax=unclassified Demequina TaxID=2620311 RepID=UPI001CF1367B|nr:MULTISPECIES: type II secretion system F family protein [unclassified Demequina]MCB2414054.1 type II secretion system F family protein [Demequina sp. TTPB684]UPU89235.1 type II secretion system F family protein [Demequina sp. TMPB413]
MATVTKMYEFTARDGAGKIQKNTMEAPSESAVAARLREKGLTPLQVTEQGGKGLNRELSIPGFGEKITLKDIAVMSRQLATMISSGLSLLRALMILAEQTESKPLAKVLSEVRSDVETGQSFSKALAKHPKVFPPIMLNMVKAGEIGGFLDDVLVSIAKNFENEVALRGKVKSAMTYPVVVFFIAILAVVAMLLFIVPVFAGMFEDLGGDLPFATQILVNMSNFLRVGSPFLIVGIILFMAWWGRNKHRYEVRAKIDPIKLKVPVFGMLVRKIALARFTRNFGSMVRAGVPILQALDIVGQASGNIVIEKATTAVQDSVRRGQSLAGPLAQHSVFPPMVVQMMAVGEDTGALDVMLDKIADFYDQEVESTTEQLTSLIEPIMIAVLGGLIGGMVIALYMPIFKVFELIG